MNWSPDDGPVHCLICFREVGPGGHDCPGPPGAVWLDLADWATYGGWPVSRAMWVPGRGGAR